MNEKKYELLKDDSIKVGETTLYRIRALRDFKDVKAGDLGGYIESEENLSHEGNCWVYDSARVCGNAQVYDNAVVYAHANIAGNARICDNAQIGDKAQILDNAVISGNTEIVGNTFVTDNAKISGDVTIKCETNICYNAYIESDKDFCHFTNIDEHFPEITAFRLDDDSAYISCEGICGDLDWFKEIIKVSQEPQTLLAVLEVIKAKFGIEEK